MINHIKKPNIMYLMAGHPSIFGGGKRVFLQIMTHLDKKKSKFYSCCAFNQEQEDLLRKEGGTIIHLDIQNGGVLSNIRVLVSLLRKEKINIIHSQGARADFYSRLTAKLSGHDTKVINTIATLVEDYNIGFFKKFAYYVLDRILERYTDKFIVVSDNLKRALIINHRIPEKRITKIYNGIEFSEYQPPEAIQSSKKIKAEFCIKEKEVFVCFIGRLVWEKGTEFFLRAIPLILKTLPDTKILLVGDGPLRESLEDLSKRQGLKDHVIFTGFRNDIKEILSAIDLIVVPSLKEGFPMITLEAMAMAKAIIATSIDGITEQITDGREGLLVPPGDADALSKAIIKVIEDKELAHSLGSAARKRVEKEFTVEKMISETENIYQSLLK